MKTRKPTIRLINFFAGEGEGTSTQTPPASEAGNTPPVEPTPAASPELTPEQLNTVREQIRMEERQRNQTRVSELEGQAQVLAQQANEARAAATTAQEEAQTIRGQLEALSSSTAEGNVDPAQLIQEVSAQVEERTRAATEREMTAMQAQLNAIQADNARLQVEAYRSTRLSALQANGTKLITEMVQGNTTEEVEASIQTSIATWEKHFGTTGTNPAAPTTPPATPPANPAVPPVAGPTPITNPASTGSHTQQPAPSGQEGVQQLLNQVKGPGNDAAYAENRQALIAAAGAEFTAAGGENVNR